MNTQKNIQRSLLLLTVIASGLFFQSCTFGAGKVIKGDGNVITTTHDVENFQNIDIQGVFDIILIPGAGMPVLLETDENLQELIDIKVRNNTLYVSQNKDAVYRHSKMRLQIPYSELEKIYVGGACKLRSDDPLISDKMLFDISGAADIDLALDVSSLQTKVSGAANIKFNGRAKKHNVRLSGASNIRAEELRSDNTDISLSGAGSAHIYASEKLEAALSGVGSIRYYGEPNNIKINKSGIGSIRAVNQ
jgi:hypothetical protein